VHLLREAGGDVGGVGAGLLNPQVDRGVRHQDSNPEPADYKSQVDHC